MGASMNARAAIEDRRATERRLRHYENLSTAILAMGHLDLLVLAARKVLADGGTFISLTVLNDALNKIEAATQGRPYEQGDME